MARWRSTIFHLSIICIALAQNDIPSESCKSSLEACENDLECSNRLAPLIAACTTGTCQPQCRNAVLNVYQNKLGRSLLSATPSGVYLFRNVKTNLKKENVPSNARNLWLPQLLHHMGMLLSTVHVQSVRINCARASRIIFWEPAIKYVIVLTQY
uniref:ShKT domain-containing protein n=1 Tax=Heterorhabditis bacteriophora TaxID=37862 RepID=A0A1I7XA98_HETBA